MSNQEVLTRVVLHLRKQKCKSVGADPNRPQRLDTGEIYKACLYRGPNGTMCAAGVLIPDGKYTTEMEGKTVQSDLLLPLFQSLEIDVVLLSDMQTIHDRSPVCYWEDEFARTAQTWGLVVPPLD